MVKTVGYHTLTVEILAKTAEAQRYDANTLKKAIETDLKANVEVSRQSAEVEKIGTYLSTVFNMSKLEENELWLMKQFTCLPPEYLSYDLLYELTTDEENEHKEIFAETLQALQKKGWLLCNSETDSYKMHRIVAEVVKKLHAIMVDDVKSLIEAITGKLSMDYAKDNPIDKFIWVPFGKTIAGNFNEDSSNEIARLQNNLATVLKDLGDYEGAKGLLEKAMASDEKNFGKDHPSAARRYSNLAIVLQDLGDYEGAKGLLEKAMASDEKNFGKDHPSTAIRYSNLAMVLKDLGDYEGAKGLLEKAMASAEKNFGKDHPSAARSYSNLAIVLQDLGDYEGAKGLLEKAMASDEKNFGKDHPSAAIRYSNLAMVLQDLGDYEGAKGLLEKAMASAENNFGKDHPSTALRYWNMSAVLRDLGQYQQALGFCEKAIDIYNKTLSKGHPYIKKVNDTYQSIKNKIEKKS